VPGGTSGSEFAKTVGDGPVRSPIPLSALLDEYRHLAHAAHWPRELRRRGFQKIAAGYRQHGDASGVNAASEALAEAIDLGGGYPAIAMAQGRWHWLWWVVVVLAGICGRILLYLEKHAKRNE